MSFPLKAPRQPFYPERGVMEFPCIIWTGTLTNGGYGITKIPGTQRNIAAHRLAYRLLVGEFDDALQLDHLCGVRACINPLHLEPITGEENRRRAIEQHGTPGYCRRGHDLTVHGSKRSDRNCMRCNACARIASDQRTLRSYLNGRTSSAVLGRPGCAR